LISVAAGALAAFVYARFGPQNAASPAPGSRAEQRRSARVRARKTEAVAPVIPAAPQAAKADHSASASPKPAASQRTSRAATATDESEPTAVEIAQAKAEDAAGAETLSRAQLETMLTTTLSGKLGDRELTSTDYSRLVDAILRIRAAQRVLDTIPESDPGASVRFLHAGVLQAAFAEMTEITGVAPQQLGDVLAGGEVENPGAGTGHPK
jgi:hypothetical protein